MDEHKEKLKDKREGQDDKGKGRKIILGNNEESEGGLSSGDRGRRNWCLPSGWLSWSSMSFLLGEGEGGGFEP